MRKRHPGSFSDADFEPERYELREEPRYHFDPPTLAEVDRRGFLKILTAMGGGLLVVSVLPERAAAQQGESGRGGQRGTSNDLASWIHIDDTGHVTVFTGKVEIGQNIRTSLAQTVADELSVPLSAISMVMADTDLTPYDGGTVGSQTTPRMAPILARAAATAREMMFDEAGRRLSADRTRLMVSDGMIVALPDTPKGVALNGAFPQLHYGDLVKDRPLVGVVSATASEMPRTSWKVRGSAPHKVDGRDFVTGRHEYASDITRPGMLAGRVVRPPAYGATPKSVDDSKAHAMAGVSVVRDGNFIGVVAPNDRVLKRAVAAMNVSWDIPTGQPTSETVYDILRQTGQTGARFSSQLVPASSRTFEASYRIPYIAHVSLEPRAAVAEWIDGKLTVWTGSQRPFGVRTEVAQAFSIPEDRVRVIVPDMGSGYGGKHTGEVATEAARLAKAAGKPVKVVYTRDEEFMWAYFRPGGVIDVKASVDLSSRTISAWEFDNYNSGNAGLASPYRITNRREAFHNAQSPLRQGSYRGLAATANHYVREMHMDAIARELGVDPVEFRLKHLEDARVRAVLMKVAEAVGWPKPSAAGRALGIACGTEKGSYVATAAEISRGANAQSFVVNRIVIAFECGAIVNPDGLKNQVQGAVVQGLGGALFEQIEFAEGRILNGTMADYRVPRFKDVPQIDVILVDRRDLPSAGAGETPIVCVAPAIGSAARNFGDVATKLPVSLR